MSNRSTFSPLTIGFHLVGLGYQCGGRIVHSFRSFQLRIRDLEDHIIYVSVQVARAIDSFYLLAESNDYVPYSTIRELDSITFTEGHQSD